MGLGDVLVLPVEFGRKEVAWPFTENGKYLDDTLKAKGFSLIKKEFMQLHEGGISLCRHYKLGGWNYYQAKNIFLPSMSENTLTVAYHSFRSEDVTWFGRTPAIPAQILVERLGQIGVGEEHYATEQRAFLIDLSIRSDPNSELQIAASGVLRTDSAYHHLGPLLGKSDADLYKSKGQFDTRITYCGDRLRKIISTIINFE